MQVSGRARRTQEPIGSHPAITRIVTIQVIGNTGNGGGSTMTAGCTVVGPGATATTKVDRDGKRRGYSRIYNPNEGAQNGYGNNLTGLSDQSKRRPRYLLH